MQRMIQETNSKIDLDKISLIFSNLYPPVRSYQRKDKKIFILGSPIYNDSINNETVKERLFNGRLEDFVKDINGSFLFVVYEGERKRLNIANDRFASISFYYRVDKGTFTGAINYSDIWREFRNRYDFKINQEAFYEFIYMHRLYGNKTYDSKTKFLDSASILTYQFDKTELEVSKYWQPNCHSNISSSLDENAHRLAYLIQQSFKRTTSDSKRYGILLSGGLDSRSVLAASDKPLVCFTTCECKNNEYFVAKELGQTKNYEHIFIVKPRTYYSDIINDATYLGGGMGIYGNAHFFNVGEAVKKKVDVLFHGYGFDFFFRGKYLPNTVHPLLEKITYKRKFIPIGADAKGVSEEFIENISYRLRSVDPLLLLKYKFRRKMVDSLYYGISDIVDEAKLLFDDPYKWWDYTCFHNVSRHYTWLNLLSIRIFVEERTLAFDNDLFDFYWSLDPSLRLNGNIFIKAIKMLDQNVFKVRYANTNLSLGDPAILTSAKIILNKVLKETRLNKIFTKSLPPPSPKERSWPIDAYLIRDNQKIRRLVLGLSNSSALETLSFLNMDVVRSCIQNHLEGRADHTNLILGLLTLEAFLES